MPIAITKGTSATDANPQARDSFLYGPDLQRFYKKSEFKDDNGFLSTEHTFYIDGIEEIIPAATSQYSLINKAPISEGVMFIQTVTRANGGVESGFEYLHKDYLDSTEVVTDENGYRLISFAYDAFGSRRHADWSKALTDSELKTLAKTLNIKNRRGFTGHEHLDRTGIIHMNGRIYDPVLARFLSPDPLVSNPYFSQSYNRYSYVLNNPLGMTDPSGYSPSCTSDDGCTEARTERLAGPDNYIAHSRHYKKQKGTQSRAAGRNDKDKSGELLIIRGDYVKDTFVVNCPHCRYIHGSPGGINGAGLLPGTTVQEQLITVGDGSGDAIELLDTLSDFAVPPKGAAKAIAKKAAEQVRKKVIGKGIDYDPRIRKRASIKQGYNGMGC